FVEGVLLGAQSEVAVEGRVVPRGLAQDAYAALARLELPGGELQERRFAGAIRAEQTRDAGVDPQRQLVDADDVAVPLGDAVELDDRRYLNRSSDFTRVCRIHAESPKRPASTPADQYHGYCGPATTATARSNDCRRDPTIGREPRSNTANSGPTEPLVL